MNAKSKRPRIALIVIITTITILVSLQASKGVGQVTLRNSPTVSRHHLVIALVFPSFFFFFSGIFISQLCLKRRRVMWRRYSFISRPGRNRTHSLLFWRQALCQLSYWPILLCGCSEKFTHPHFSLLSYFVSLCKVCFLQREQYFFISIRPGSLRRFFSVV